MLIVVTTVGLLVHVYSIGYMHGDAGFYRFFSYLPLFVFSMLMLVLADNFLVLFIFWEAVGLCSYLLIGYYFQRRSANNAAKKAFIVNRIGDLGFGLGIMLIFSTFGTLDFFGDDGVFAQARTPDSASRRHADGDRLLLFIGACGKSAQFPLHVWLPDAMEGPTPVSALIHAATMVTAGIYMVARSHRDLYRHPKPRMLVIAIDRRLHRLHGRDDRLTQNDIKRVVAYSTVSQLGYMVFALGTGAWVAGDLPSDDARVLQGSALPWLRLRHPRHARGAGHPEDGRPAQVHADHVLTFLVGALANAGVIPLAGFWSKDEIIVGAWASRFPDWGKLVAIVGLAAAFLTALYMFRLVFLVFFTKSRFEPGVHPHESGTLDDDSAGPARDPSLLIGFVGFPPEKAIPALPGAGLLPRR